MTPPDVLDPTLSMPSMPLEAEPVQPRTLFQRLGGLAMTAAAGIAMHKGLHSEVLGAPVEHLQSPVSEVAEIAVIGSVLAVTGLGEAVTNARIGIAHHRLEQAKAKNPENEAEHPRGFIMRRWYDFRQIRGNRAFDRASKRTRQIPRDAWLYGKPVLRSRPKYDNPVGDQRFVFENYWENDFGTPIHMQRIQTLPNKRNRRRQYSAIKNKPRLESSAQAIQQKTSHKLLGKYQNREASIQAHLEKLRTKNKSAARLGRGDVKLGLRGAKATGRGLNNIARFAGEVRKITKPSAVKEQVKKDTESLKAWQARRASAKGSKPSKKDKQRERAIRQAQNRRGVL
jgi:hypothetical protein